MKMRATVATATLIATLTTAAQAGAVPTVNGEFDIPDGVGSNNEITQGPDNNMWVTRQNANGVARITPEGVVTPFPTTNSATGITTGPDNNLWVTTALGVAKIDPASGAEIDTYDVGLPNGSSITAGLDGMLYAAAGDKLARFSPADPEGTDTAVTIAGMASKGMATGSDGTIWIADNGGRILATTPSAAPVVTEYTVGAQPQDVAAGPATQVAYATSGDHEIGLITPPGPAIRNPLETSDPFGVAFGTDGAYWIARSSKDDLARLTTDGQVSFLGGFSISGNVGPRKVAAGPNNTLWVTLDQQDKVARVTGVDPPATGGDLDTVIDKAPKKKMKLKGNKKKAKAKFKFSSATAGATFECSLKPKGKKPKFKACKSPKTYKLKPGKYRFEVRAKTGGLVDATPAVAKLKVVEA
jgi:virginiamycin B lyase